MCQNAALARNGICRYILCNGVAKGLAFTGTQCIVITIKINQTKVNLGGVGNSYRFQAGRASCGHG